MSSEKLSRALSDKQALFENISHELKTPLTIILAEIEFLQRELVQEKSVGRVKLIEDRATYLLSMINRMLDAARLNAQIYEYERVDAVEETQRILASFRSALEPKNIKLIFATSLYHKNIILIGKTLDIILGNLLQNSAKYAVGDNKIRVDLSETETGCVLWRVSDNKTIVNEWGDLSQRYSRSREHTTEPGQGLGFSIIKEYVNAHSGEFKLDFNQGVTASFTLCPFSEDRLPKHLSDNTELDSTEQDSNGNVAEFSLPTKDKQKNSTQKSEGAAEDTPENTSRLRILCVDDEPDILRILSEALTPWFDVELCEDGGQAIQILNDFYPDLIISDVMMPKLDGYQLCEQVKSNPDTCQIPLILLTAKSDYESEKMGLGHQADDYISKPFSPALLLQKIRNQMRTLNAQREKARRQWQRVQSVQPDIEIHSLDDPFLLSMHTLLKQNLASSDFGVTALAASMRVHPKTLNRRCSSILGKKPLQLIREFRVGQAKQRIEDGDKLISVAHACGFSDQAHLSRVFKAETGCSPSQWLAKIQPIS